jgi:type III secretion protein L
MDNKILKPDALGEKGLVSSPKVLKREVYEATLEARDVVALAQEKAKQILEEAERQREQITEQARQEGIARGLAEWNEILVRTSQRAEALSRDWEEKMLRLSIKVAEKIIGKQLNLHGDTIVEIVREVLKTSRPGKRLTIQVNEQEADEVRHQVASLKELLGADSEIAVLASSSVAPGGCMVESELGIIDARLETQLKCLENALVRGVSAE